MNALINFWSHALAASLFGALTLWRLRSAAREPAHRLLAAAFALTACWAWLSAVTPGDTMTGYAESARNLLWVTVLYGLSSADDREHRLKLVYGAVAAVIGLRVIGATVQLFAPSPALAQTALILRVTTAAGALVLVHNVYGQAAPASRSHIRFAMLALAAMWIYDLNFYTLLYLGSGSARALLVWRGLAVSLTAPLFALALRDDSGWRVRLSRAATFQSLSLLALCAYFALMAILATALRGLKADWSTGLMIAVLAVMTVSAVAILPSARARSWAKVKIAKHLFEHRYDYRSEWLRFTETLGRAGVDAPPLGERIIKAFADILESPGGLLLTSDEEGIAEASELNWDGVALPVDFAADTERLWSEIETSGRIVELDGLRQGRAGEADKSLSVPRWMIEDPAAWTAVPLLHRRRLVGLVLLAAPEFRRPLDWEDFDLLRTAGNQAASSLAEALGQEALVNAQRFEEFNRRFAFILHDIKNLVSQLSLLARNAERHADNPEFREDMVATLQSSVGKMNDLLARLAPHSGARVGPVEAKPLHPILSSAIAAKGRNRDVQLVGDATASAKVDPAALEQAVAHLLQNALDASSETAVTIRVSGRGPVVAISVTDQGVGMDGEFVRNRLFKPFSSTKASGFGIGAFEARSLVTAMGGRLTVDSKPGHGTTFTIILPAAEPAIELQRKIA